MKILKLTKFIARKSYWRDISHFIVSYRFDPIEFVNLVQFHRSIWYPIENPTQSFREYFPQITRNFPRFIFLDPEKFESFDDFNRE